MRAAHYCQECGKVQPPGSRGLLRFFRASLQAEPRHRSTGARLLRAEPQIASRHQRRANAPEQEWSLEKTSQLNDAYRTLKDPISRTEYLLRLQGVQLEEQSKAATDEARKTGSAKKQVVPPDLLEEVFELNMQLEELRMNKKMGEDDPALERHLRDAKQHLPIKQTDMLQELERGMEASGTRWSTAPATGEDVEENDRASVRDKMIDILNRRAYLRNLLREVDEVLEG